MPSTRMSSPGRRATLEIARLDEVAVDDADETDSATHQVIRQYSAQCTASAECHPAVDQFFLPDFADGAKSHLPAVTLG